MSTALKVSRILHAGYIFESGGARIAFDPIFENPFSRNCYAFPYAHFDLAAICRERFDAVFISHFHDDHCSFESLDLLDRETPLYVFCVYEELFELVRELGFREVHSLQLGVPITVGPDFFVTPLRAVDADVDSMFHIQAGDLNVLNVVDSWMDPSMLEQLSTFSPWDLVLWPFQTMRELEVLAPRRARITRGDPPRLERSPLPEEWCQQLVRLNPRFLVPSSCQFRQEDWSWYNHALFPVTYSGFAEEMSRLLPSCEVVRLNPGCGVVLKSRLEAGARGKLTRAEPLSWVIPVGDQNVDYDYRKDLVPPPTSEIAKHFAPLSLEQTKRVRDYCERGLLEKFQSMDPPESEYFSEARLWRLTLYDSAGFAENYFYEVKGNKIHTQLSKSSDDKQFDFEVGWVTEIPSAKLYAALELGETLTSLYIRINDVDFNSAIEAEMSEVEIIEDPLIRCLYTGVFGAYQRAQLKRLRGGR